jgi:uncharacterized protein
MPVFSKSPGSLNEFGERLIPLCDGRAGLRGGLPVEVRDAPAVGPSSDPTPDPVPAAAQAAVLEFIASSERLDRHDEILVSGGWVLDSYRSNPVFQNAHKYGDIIFTLGKALLTEVRGGRLYQRVEFATEINPMAKIAYGLYRGKFLNAVSVGFIPLRWEMGGEGSGFYRKYWQQELLEVSAVGIPANPEALQLGLKAGAIERSDLQDLLELIETLLRGLGAGAAPSPGPHSGGSSHGAGTAWSPACSIRGRESDCKDRETRPSPVRSASRPSPVRASNSFCSKPAATNTFACASGVRGYEAQLLRLACLARRALRR